MPLFASVLSKGMMKKSAFLEKISLFGLVLLTCFFDLPTWASPSGTDSSNNTAASTSEKIVVFHRLDFRIEGKSCAACLLSIQRKLNGLPGVKEAIVMLKSPYGVSVIYKPSQIEPEEIMAVIKDKEPNIKILEVSDAVVSSVTAPLIPPFVPFSDSAKETK